MTYRGLAVHLLVAATVDLDWSSRRPSKGKCTVTTLVVQDYLGGELLRAPVEDVSHYWNRLSDGTIIRVFQSRRNRRPAKQNYHAVSARAKSRNSRP